MTHSPALAGERIMIGTGLVGEIVFRSRGKFRVVFAWVICAALAAATGFSAFADAVSDAQPGWNYTGGGANTPLIRFDDRGGIVPLPLPTSPEARAQYEALRRSENFTIPVGGRDRSIDDLLDSPDLSMAAVSLNTGPSGQISVNTSDAGAPCAQDRRPLGRLLYCLNALSTAATSRVSSIEHLASEARALHDRALATQLETTARRARNLGAGLRAIMGGLARRYHLSSLGATGTGVGDGQIERFSGSAVTHGSPIRGRDGQYSSTFLACMNNHGLTSHDYSMELRLLDSAEACRRARESDLQPFAPEISGFFGNVTAGVFMDEYLRTLRMEALVRTMNQARQFTGQDIQPSCGPDFRDGVSRITSGPRPANRLADPAYRAGLQQAATRMKQDLLAVNHLQHLLGDARNLIDCTDAHITPDGKTCDPDLPPEPLDDNQRAQIQDEINRLNERIVEKAGQYPYLITGYHPGDDPSNLFGRAQRISQTRPQDLEAELAPEKAQIAADLKATAEKFCTGNGSNWDDLIMMPDLVKGVIDKAHLEPFKYAQACAENEYKAKKSFDDANAALANGLGQGACMVLGVTPLGVITGPICMLATIGKSAYEYERAGRELEWKRSCQYAHGAGDSSICSQDDFRRASDRYDQAVTDLGEQLVYAAGDRLLNGLGQIAELRAAASAAHSAEELDQAAAALRRAHSLEEAESASSTALGRAGRATATTVEEDATALGGAGRAALGPELEGSFASGRSRLEALGRSSAGRGIDTRALEADLEEISANLTPDKRAAILRAHGVGEGGTGRFTTAELKQKAKILQDAGFSQEEREALLRSGICGDPARVGELPAPLPADKVAKAEQTIASQNAAGLQMGRYNNLQEAERLSGEANAAAAEAEHAAEDARRHLAQLQSRVPPATADELAAAHQQAATSHQLAEEARRAAHDAEQRMPAIREHFAHLEPQIAADAARGATPEAQQAFATWARTEDSSARQLRASFQGHPAPVVRIPNGADAMLEARGVGDAASKAAQRMTRPNDFVAWAEELRQDAASRMMSSHEPQVLAKIGGATHQIDGDTVVEVLRERLAEKGLKAVHLPQGCCTTEQFAQFLRRGEVPIDNNSFAIGALETGGHGRDIHAIQVAYAVADMSPAEAQGLVRTMGEAPDGGELWNSLFDRDSPTEVALGNPEFLAPRLRELLGTR